MEISPSLSPPSAMDRLACADDPGAGTLGALTSGLAAGDEDAFGRFHSLYFNRLLRYHLVVARGDEQAARDALQETYRRVVRHARRFDDDAAFWSWLTVLARSAACDASRARQRYGRLLAKYARWFNAPEPGPDHGDADETLAGIVAASLGELVELDRVLMEGKYLRGATVRELAAEHGLTAKAVESRLLRARRILREKALKKLNHEQ